MVILFENGETAVIAGAQLVMSPGNAKPLSSLSIAALTNGVAIDVSELAPPIMYATIDFGEGPVKAAMNVRVYNQLALAARPQNAVAPRAGRTFLNTASTARTAIKRQFGGCCGAKK